MLKAMSNSPRRPKIKISKTKSEWIWDIIGYSFYFVSLLFLINNWNELPDEVPSHFDALGEVDRWGSKMELIIFPINRCIYCIVNEIV